jgi:hypothetical protein
MGSWGRHVGKLRLGTCHLLLVLELEQRGMELELGSIVEQLVVAIGSIVEQLELVVAIGSIVEQLGMVEGYSG